MQHNQRICRLATAIPTLALAFVTTCIHADSFTQTNLVSDVPGLAANTDPNLKNPWGVAFSGTSPFWTADQVTGLSTLYNAAGVPQALVVSIPVGAPPSGPTGAVFGNVAGSFLVNGTPATFIFDTLNGTLAGWNASAGTTAVQTAATPGAIYTYYACPYSPSNPRHLAAHPGHPPTSVSIREETIIAAAKETGLSIPLVVRLEGNNVAAGKKTLDESGLALISASDLADAAKKVVAAIGKAA